MQCVCGDCGYEHESAWDGTPCPKCNSLRVIPVSAAGKIFGADWRETCFGPEEQPEEPQPAVPPYGYQHQHCVVSPTAIERPCQLCEDK